LDLQNNHIVNLPPELGLLTNLQKLVLDNNPLKTVPGPIVRKGTPTVLDFLRGRLTQSQVNLMAGVPAPVNTSGMGGVDVNIFLEAETSGKLNLSNLNLDKIPPHVFEMPNLVQLVLNKNQLTEIPPDIKNLKKLKIFKVEENKFTEVKIFPPAMRVTEISFCRNKISKVDPEAFTDHQFEYLETLNLSTNLLTDTNFLKLVSFTLTELNLSYNTITVLIPDIGELVSLKYLRLNNNKLKVLPNEILNCKQLHTIDIAMNDVASLNPELSLLPHLQVLSVEGNPIRTIKREILLRSDALITYLHDRVSHK